MSGTAWAKQLRQWRSHLKQTLFPLDSPRYKQGQVRFLRRRLRLALMLALVAYPTFMVLRLLMAALGVAPLDLSWLTMAAVSTFVLLVCLFLHRSRFGIQHLNWIFLGCSWTITLSEQIWATARGVAFLGVFSWTLVFLVQATLMPVRWHLHLISQLGLLVYYVGVNGLLGLTPENGALWDASLWLYLFWFCAICNVSVYLYETLQRSEFRARMELEAEREKSEKLLLNILPEAVARRLKQDQRTIAEHFAEASVLFADIVGFTQLSTGVPPEALVTMLNQIFSAFDYLAEKHGLEKIKTIGDSYMVVGGLPLERADHLEAIANMALDMQQALDKLSLEFMQSDIYPTAPFQMRIGINAGPVIAGVIGVKKFIYDLWGDTVNTASRMESHGVPGGIQVTEAVYVRLREHYRFEERGILNIKGKGLMKVYLLRRKL